MESRGVEGSFSVVVLTCLFREMCVWERRWFNKIFTLHPSSHASYGGGGAFAPDKAPIARASTKMYWWRMATTQTGEMNKKKEIHRKSVSLDRGSFAVGGKNVRMDRKR
jgi:hypothetical protein